MKKLREEQEIFSVNMLRIWRLDKIVQAWKGNRLINILILFNYFIIDKEVLEGGVSVVYQVCRLPNWPSITIIV